MESFDAAIVLKPASVEAYVGRGNTLIRLKRFGNALASYERAIALAPEDANANFSKAFVHLIQGDYENGWRLYEWRWQAKDSGAAQRGYGKPLWLGNSDLVGRAILLHAEQGLGDTLQFCRYARLVADRGAKVIFVVQSALKSLLGSLPGASVVHTQGDVRPEFDYQCPLLSLPLAFKTDLSNIPADVPYLYPDPRRVNVWCREIGARRGSRRIGLVWSGSPQHKNDHNRSMPLTQLNALLRIPNVEFISLQKELRGDDRDAIRSGLRVRHLGDGLQDLADTAALLSLMDLVISVDTAVAHLAGALAKPVWILLPFLPDWRWLLDREESPWYPTARLYRQDRMGDWDSVIERVAFDLQRLTEGAGVAPPASE